MRPIIDFAYSNQSAQIYEQSISQINSSQYEFEIEVKVKFIKKSAEF